MTSLDHSWHVGHCAIKLVTLNSLAQCRQRARCGTLSINNCAPAKVGLRLVSISKQKVNESVTTPLASPIFSRTPFTCVELHSAARASTTSTILWAIASSCMTSLAPHGYDTCGCTLCDRCYMFRSLK